MSKKKFRKFNRDEVFISKEEIEKFNTENARLLHLIRMSNPKGESVLFKLYNEHHISESLDKFECGCDIGTGKDQSVDYFLTKVDGGVKIEIPSVNLEFTKTLNELKNKKPMEITEETMIKDLIPEGYEISTQTISTNGIHIDIKKKEVKDFDWYVKKYSGYDPDKSPRGGGGVYDPKGNTPMSNYNEVMRSQYYHVPFEFKIGLLKFICDDLHQDFWINVVQIRRRMDRLETLAISKVCPPEFLNSIFK